MNYSDAERIATVLEHANFCAAKNINEADFIVLITCSVKQKAEDKVYSAIGNLYKIKKKEKKDLKIILTGCMVKKTSNQQSVEKDPLLKKTPKLTAVFRIEDLANLNQLLNLKLQKELPCFDKHSQSKIDYLNFKPKYSSNISAIVAIQIGCDNFCAYCVVPYTRGREVSRPIIAIVKEIQLLAEKGIKEILLVGQNVNSYGKNFENNLKNWNIKKLKWEGVKKTPFTILLEKVNKIKGIERIRFQSSNSHDMTDDIIKSICSLEKIMPNLHFALQSGNDQVLQRMNCRYTYVDYKNIVKKIRALRVDFSITTDIVVGFCGETKEEFKNTLKAVKEINIDLIYISQYSMRPGTLAAKKLVDDISLQVKKERWHCLNNWLKNHLKQKMKKLIGSTQKVLIEKIKKDWGEGKTEYNVHCQCFGKKLKIGEIVEVKIIESSEWVLSGRVNK